MTGEKKVKLRSIDSICDVSYLLTRLRNESFGICGPLLEQSGALYSQLQRLPVIPEASLTAPVSLQRPISGLLSGGQAASIIPLTSL